jgi:hypothetical protein
MMAHSQTIFSDRVSLERVAGHWVKKTGYMLSKGIEFRRTNPGEEFTDVFYEDLVESPMRVLGELYSNGLSISPALNQKFLDTDRLNAPNRYGTHKYNLNDFNIDPGELNNTVSLYSDFLKTIQR